MYLDNNLIKKVTIRTDDKIIYCKNYHNIALHHEILSNEKMSKTIMDVYFSLI